MTDYFSVPLGASHLLKARNYEFEVAYSSIVKELKRHEFEDLYVVMSIENVTRHEEDVKKLSNRDLAHDASALIAANVSDSHVALVAIARSVDSFGKLSGGSDKQHALVLHNWVRKPRSNMTSNQLLRQLEAVSVLRASAAGNESVMEALDALGLRKLYEKVVQMHDELDLLLSGRNDDLAELKDLREGFREQVVFDIQLLFDALLAAANVESDMQEEYQEICRRIDFNLVFGRSVIRARTTRAENERPEEEQKPSEGDAGDSGNDVDDSENDSGDSGNSGNADSLPVAAGTDNREDVESDSMLDYDANDDYDA